MADVLREFLVSIGFATDAASARRAEAEAKRVEDAVVSADRRITSTQVAGSAARTIAANRERGIRTRGAAQLIAEHRAQQKAVADYTEKDAEASKKRHDGLGREQAAQRHHGTSFASFLSGMVAAAAAASVGIATAMVKIAGGLEQTFYASKRTNTTANNLRAFQYAASQLGSTGEEALQALEGFSEKMRASPGYEEMVKTLGVQTRDAKGNLRQLSDQFADLGDLFATFPEHKAKAYANALDISPHLLAALKGGEFKRRMAEYNELLAGAGLDRGKAAQASKEFMEIWRKMTSAIEIVVIKIQDALIKRFGGSVDKFTSWLVSNSGRIADAFVRIGEVALRLVDHIASLFSAFDKLSPAAKDMLIKFAALAAALLVFNSGPLGALVAVTAALAAFLDEAKLKKLGEMWDKFDALAKKLTGEDGVTVAFAALAAVLALKVLVPLTKVMGLLTGFMGLSLPAWLLTMLGVSAGIAGIATADQMPKALQRGGASAVDPATGGASERSVTEGLIEPGQEGWAGRWVKRKWGQAKQALGLGGDANASTGIGRRAERSRRQTEASGGARQFSEASPTEAAGKYRPVYTPGDADLSQRTADIIAGEAIRRNPQSIDAVINNMMNRVGSKGWGPSKNLLEVATAPGQYEASWKGSKASPAETEYIRSRIRAIASGGVPDNTNGSNAFRASGYRGPWYYRHGVNGAVVGGNRFAYEPKAPNGPYAPYKTPRTESPAVTAIPKLESVLQNFNDRWGAEAPQPFQGRPLGTWTTSNVNTTNNIRIESPTSVSVSGVGDAKAVGSEVTKTQSRVHADLLRNLQGAVA